LQDGKFLTASIKSDFNYILTKKFTIFYRTRRFNAVFTTAPTCPYPEPQQSSPRLRVLKSSSSRPTATNVVDRTILM